MFGLADNDANFGKRFRNDESVPAFHPPAARIFHINREDWRTGFLREENKARSNFIGWTTRTIRCDHNVLSAGEHVAELKQSARTELRTRAADNIVLETMNRVAEEIAVAARAN